MMSLKTGANTGSMRTANSGNVRSVRPARVVNAANMLAMSAVNVTVIEATGSANALKGVVAEDKTPAAARES
jgi:hypothetical protein